MTHGIQDLGRQGLSGGSAHRDPPRRHHSVCHSLVKLHQVPPRYQRALARDAHRSTSTFAWPLSPLVTQVSRHDHQWDRWVIWSSPNSRKKVHVSFLPSISISAFTSLRQSLPSQLGLLDKVISKMMSTLILPTATGPRLAVVKHVNGFQSTRIGFESSNATLLA